MADAGPGAVLEGEVTAASLRAEDGAIAFAERLLALLDEGSFTATYKYAVLLGLLDLCMEGVSAAGLAPDVLTTRQLAEKVIHLYWPHAAPYDRLPTPDVLRQNTSGQAEIVVVHAAVTSDRLDLRHVQAVGRHHSV